jgi:hypothetical protein
MCDVVQWVVGLLHSYASDRDFDVDDLASFLTRTEHGAKNSTSTAFSEVSKLVNEGPATSAFGLYCHVASVERFALFCHFLID